MLNVRNEKRARSTHGNEIKRLYEIGADGNANDECEK